MGQRGRCPVGNCLGRPEVRTPHGEELCRRCATVYFGLVMQAFRRARGQRRRRENRANKTRARWAKRRATDERRAANQRWSDENARKWAQRAAIVAAVPPPSALLRGDQRDATLSLFGLRLHREHSPFELLDAQLGRAEARAREAAPLFGV